ncbi:MAG: bifunctional [glutamate--ammonia ligase]-adenylyl-L-tyrosine phosphorylase/[glutamate--ammonia-ligase] adenylyltransferase [Steroidobacteraceae bacterium]|nr:bifunctional [glutamate--ammonia ligase]-adenylyl-L-tyrosine phosphorylase/[glutamate--ammonia-ligase] adenylyltransferase [Steroidobacteraceae bacterium]
MPAQAPDLLDPVLSQRANEALERILAAGAAELPEGLEPEARLVCACSDFVAKSLEREPGLLGMLFEEGGLGWPRTAGEYDARAQALVAANEDEAAFMAALRGFRRRELVRIAWRDLAGRAALPETLAELSALADAAIRAARDFALRSLAPRFGTPRSASGEPQELVVLGMGKLGGGELNFSSDIDLVFLYPEGGETDGRRPVANEEYFTRLGQMLIRLLDAPTVEGFVYRVDMRLRPFGESGSLVASFGALEDYLQQHGRDWERYAWIKARAITGADRYAELFDEVVRPFVYRRYLDFGVFDSLRSMKAMIEREVERRELRDNVKLGPGGIREIEFIVQAMQLIRGGSDRRLQSPSLLSVLPRLEGAKLLTARAVRELAECYAFLRRAENRLQMVDDGQVHALPEAAQDRARLAASMGHGDWDEFAAALERTRRGVVGHFRSVVFGPEREAAASEVALDALWAPEPDEARVAAEVAGFGVEDAPGVTQALMALRGSAYFRRLDEHGRRRLERLLPRVLAAVRRTAPAADGEPEAALIRRLAGILEAIGGRTAYLSLLYENPQALERLVEVCRHGEFLVRQVAAFPILLDELIDARVLEELPDRAQFEIELVARLEQAGEDEERQVDALRHFRRAARFRVALLDLAGRLPLMQVSDRLTDVAELILAEAIRMAWRQLAAVHGEPMCGPPGARRVVGLAAIGYGKLGGLELGYASDLDLVFLHDSSDGEQQTAGPRVVDNAVFLNRFGQRVVHLLTVHTAAGRLYEVDMRLRPSGKGGLTVTHIDAFADYQREEAWTWEHQALLHSRSVAGSPALRARFEHIRLDILANHVRRETLREDVRGMRERMRGELARAGEGEFDLKQDRGGIADIEFLAQYWALSWARDYPPVVMYSDTIRQLESVGSAALVDHAVVDTLVDAYRSLRQAAHRQALEERRGIVDASRFATERGKVARVWEEVMVAGEPGAAV